MTARYTVESSHGGCRNEALVQVAVKAHPRHLLRQFIDLDRARVLLFNHFAQRKTPEFRILPCLGLLQNLDGGTRYDGVVFRHPYEGLERPESLHQILQGRLSVPLGDRFRLAQNLASSLFLLHSSKWLHKNFRSQNVVFFRNKTADALSTEHISLPYLIGFSYARPDRPDRPDRSDRSGEASMERRRRRAGQVELSPPSQHRHPNSAKESTRRNEIYGLRVLLLEIGHWRPVDKICGENLKGTGKHIADEQDVRRHLLAGYRKPLPNKMGTIYALAVRRCLEGTFPPSAAIVDDGAIDDDNDFVHEFWSTVIKELERRHA